MKASISLLFFALVQNSLCNVVKRTTPTTACNANNCLRGIRGTGSNIKPPLTSRLSDCSSFMTTTITIATVTTTVVPLLPRELEARQQTTSPSQVPAYATFCAASSAYSSGCSCLGITKTTLTVATPTLTKYATATSTIIPCRPGVPSCNSKCVDLNTDDANCGSCGNICQLGSACYKGACVFMGQFRCEGFGSPCGGSCPGLCYTDVNGVGWCKQLRFCRPLESCTTGSDCPSNLCLLSSCGYSLCAEAEYLCPNKLLPNMVFEKRVLVGSVEGRELVESKVDFVDSPMLFDRH